MRQVEKLELNGRRYNMITFLSISRNVGCTDKMKINVGGYTLNLFQLWKSEVKFKRRIMLKVLTKNRCN